MPFRIRIFLSVFLALLVLLAVGPFLLPDRELEGTEPITELTDEASLVEIGGVDLYHEVVGETGTAARHEGSAFLLLHGYPSNSASWRHMLPELELYGLAVSFDRPGFGYSERPPPGSWRGSAAGNPYRPSAQVAQAFALLDHLGIEEAVWIGSSSGALVALEAALEQPDRVEALVLVGAPVYANRAPPRWLRPLLHTPQMNRVGPLLMRQLGGSPGMNLFSSQWADPSRIDDADINAFRRTFEVDDWDRGLWEVSKASRTSTATARLAELRVPTLVVTGGSDPIVPPEESERLATEIPGATFALMEGCGHLPQEECPSQFSDLLLGWLRVEDSTGPE